ncbi:nucleotide exchange factor GrpE [Lentibacillus saliphilus]|uniref:nucleotide exchange factor GrpE n=1 Tax=Lentibacillus saliphilus TaxID=2737028 RepID=UPI001C2F488F|nr:nucleotide exchange factor GrpE [Lentibacillus saliphilus]
METENKHVEEAVETETHDHSEESPEQADSSEEKVEMMKAEYKTLKEEKDQLHERLLRVQAEYDNFKKRSQKEKEAARKYRSQDLVQEILPVLDNFERALQVDQTDDTKSFIEGMTMIYNQLVNALKSEGVEEIQSVGQPFDPNLHHAIMQVEDEEHDENTVIEEMQKGYLLKDRVIRPAMVKVTN